MFTRVSLALTSLVIVTYRVSKQQWSHYYDVTESQGVIHITVYYRSLSETLSTGPFALFARCAFGVGGLHSFPVWAHMCPTTITASLEESDDVTTACRVVHVMWHCGVRLYGCKPFTRKATYWQ